jgi:hypothetical protein
MRLPYVFDNPVATSKAMEDVFGVIPIIRTVFRSMLEDLILHVLSLRSTCIGGTLPEVAIGKHLSKFISITGASASSNWAEEVLRLHMLGLVVPVALILAFAGDFAARMWAWERLIRLVAARAIEAVVDEYFAGENCHQRELTQTGRRSLR